ncbi:MAG: tetratricopeptide repeat protein [Pseudomonadota bacterium]|nr:tetratricopeptide repeat protein [Pseudomonadota bacterium]
MKQFHRLAMALALISAASAAPAQAPSPPQPAASSTPAATAPAQSRLTARLMYELLISEILFRQGDAQNSTGTMLSAARRTGDEALFKRATEMAIQARSGPAALDATRAWRQSHPSSADASRYELQVLIVLGRIAETESPLRAVLASLPDDDKVAFITALPSLYQRAPDKSDAAQTVERALSEAVNTAALAPSAWTTIGRMRLQNGDKAGALAAATLGQGAGEQSEWPALLALQLMAGGEPKAEALIQRHLARADASPDVQIAYARALVEAGRSTQAQAQLDALVKRMPNHAEGWLVRGALRADERKDTEAEADLQHFLGMATSPAQAAGVNQARLMLARIAERRGDHAAAERWLAGVDSADQQLTVQSRRAQILARQGRIDEAREAIRRVPERGPEDARQKLLTEAQLLRDHQQPEQAYQLLTDELQKDPDDEGLLYDAAMVAERLDRIDEMERLMRHLIEVNPDAAHAYNALGYTLADRNLRLPEAKELIEKAVQLAPDDSYIQDSLGWVHFRMGNVPEARKLLEAAYKKRPDPEIAAHLGEVLWVLGEQEEARHVWRDGLRQDAGNETLQKTLKRLGVSL